MLRIEKDTVKVDGGQLAKVFATKHPEFVDGMIRQIINISSHGREPDEKSALFVAQVIAGVQPRDQLETMLAAQMAAVHNASITFARRLAHVETVQQQDSASRAFNQLCRTFASQVEALKRYRSKGQQVVVKHVTVKDGGQAIVGNVEQGGPGNEKN